MIRNRVKRRLRAILAEVLPTLPAGTRVVVRALPPAASASFEELRSLVADGVARSLAKAR